jgi:hypothetical protein
MTAAHKSPPGPDQRRKTPRSRVLLSGKLVFGAAEFTAACAVRDLTPEGARVRLSDAAIVCEPVWLINVGAGVAYSATIAWRTDQDLGLAFGSKIDLNAPVEAPFKRLRRIWLDSPVG